MFGEDHMPVLLRERDDDSLSLFFSNEWAITKLFLETPALPEP